MRILIIAYLLVISCTKQKEDKLIVGMELSFPPFEMQDIEGNPKGISVDLAYSLGKYLGKEVEIQHIAWNGLIPSLQTKKIDMIISSMAIIEERKEKVDFSDPYARTVIAALVYADSPVQQSSDLNSPERTITLRQGTTSYFFALNQFPEAKKNAFATETPAITEVIQGKADAFLYDWLSIYKLSKQNPKTTRMIPVDMSGSENNDWGIAVRKGDTKLLTEINAFLKDFKASGGYKVLTEKYFREEKKIFDAQGINFFF